MRIAFRALPAATGLVPRPLVDVAVEGMPPWDFHLLGQEGFFRWFRVTFEAADRYVQLESPGGVAGP